MAQKAASGMSLAQMNALARAAVVSQALEMKQAIYSQTLTGTIPGQVVNIPLRNVGLIKRLIIEISCNLAQTAAETLTQTKLGISNALSQVVLTDLNNQTRVNTAGWHLHQLATVRRGNAFGAAFTNDSPIANGSNFSVIKAPSSITTVQALRMFYEVPLAYSDTDLRGAMWANVLNATSQLQLTVNPNFVAASTTTDAILSCYQSSTAAQAAPTAFTITVYQVYLDQLPQSDKGPVLPNLDLSTAYLINNTVVTGLVANQDNPIPYANWREFLSTIAILDQNGTLNIGTDVNYWGLQAANFTNIWKVDPFLASLDTRLAIGDDMPNGVYFFNHRAKPISTWQYGNMALVLNPSSAAATTNLLIGYEALAIINMVSQAGSLYAN
jgi:hypothetical protein